MTQSVQNWHGHWWPLAEFLADASTPEGVCNWARPSLDSGAAGQSLWWAPVTERTGFALIHHPLSAEIGFWLDPLLRGQRLAGRALSAGLAAVGAIGGRQSMATVPEEAGAAQRACQAAGMQVLARPAGRVIYIFWHRDAGLPHQSTFRT